MKNKKFFLIIACIVAVMCLNTLCLPNAFAGQETLTAEDLAQINPQHDFTLQDALHGQLFHLKDHRGQIILLFFGYTACPDVCPVTLSKLARVYRLLGPKADKLLTLFVTIDPKRDTPAKLKEYLPYFSINALGLTGTKKEIDEVINLYHAVYQKVETQSSALGYMFDHTDYLYLIDAKGKTCHLFHPEDGAQEIANIILKKVINGKN